MKLTLIKPLALSPILLSVMLGLVHSAHAYQAPQEPLTNEAIENKKATNRKTPATLLTPSLHKAIQGGGMTFTYEKLPVHEGLKISFKVHFVGPWDGTGYKQWGPDRFFAIVDDKMHLLDATFNNCHIIWSDNQWQSFPDPHSYKQLGDLGRKHFLYHGGEGAKAISSLGFAWNKSASVDSSYVFNYSIKHTQDQLDLSFLTKWVEDDSPSTYWIEDIKITPIKVLKKLSPNRETQAWMSFFQGDGAQAQKAWAEVYARHPEKLIERVRSLTTPQPDRITFLLKQLKNGKTPTRAIQQEVFIDPRKKDAAQIMKRISYLRELALTQKIWKTEASPFWEQLETNPQVRSIRKAMATRRDESVMLGQISLRLSGYLRMINTRESLMLAKQFDKKDTDIKSAPAQPFYGTWKDPKDENDLGFTIQADGSAMSASGNLGKWKFAENDLVGVWENKDTVALKLMAENQCSAILTSAKDQSIKTFLVQKEVK